MFNQAIRIKPFTALRLTNSVDFYQLIQENTLASRWLSAYSSKKEYVIQVDDRLYSFIIDYHSDAQADRYEGN